MYESESWRQWTKLEEFSKLNIWEGGFKGKSHTQANQTTLCTDPRHNGWETAIRDTWAVFSLRQGAATRRDFIQFFEMDIATEYS